jgi:hypothetical protein
MINAFLIGIIVMAELVVGAYFLKFWKRTRDPLFLAFSVAFGLEALNRVVFFHADDAQGTNPWLFGVRLFCFLLILVAIVHKNVRRSRDSNVGANSGNVG